MNLPQLSRPLSILAVDDVATNRLVVSKMCELLGARVTTASGGLAAIEACATGVFDLVLMDVRMPGMDGIDASARIRALPLPTGAIPIIAVTGETADDLPARCQSVGIAAVVEKPISLRALADAIEATLAQADVPALRRHMPAA